MARINTYPGDPSFTDDDKLLGIDSATGGSATYTLGQLTTYFNTGGATNTNYYLDGITQSGNVLTFSVNGATDQTFTFVLLLLLQQLILQLRIIHIRSETL